MITDRNALKQAAISNALSSIEQNKWLPHNVFVGEWKDYLFFDPYIMFCNSFIEVKDMLLSEEHASVIALINMRTAPKSGNGNGNIICLWKESDAPGYMSQLKGDGSPHNWLFQMDRYVCASDKGKWSIYCERENDIAVLAYHKSFLCRAINRIGNILNATSIAQTYERESSQAFQFSKLVPTWRATLIAEYRGTR